MNISKLENIKNKFEELTKAISDPAVIADNKEWTKLVKEHSELEPIVTEYNNLIRIQDDIKGAEEMLKEETDPDLLEMAKEGLGKEKPKA